VKIATGLWLLVVGALTLTASATAQTASPEVRNEFAASGTMRVAINYGNPVLAHRNLATGELRGITLELGRELGHRLDVPVQLVGYETIAKLLAGLKAGEWDVAFLAIDPTRANELTFTAP